MPSSSSSSSFSSRTWRYRVFASFHGEDLSMSFLSHLQKQLNEKGNSMFSDRVIERGQSISPEIRRAIRESRISIVVLSKNYASSSWCLDELVEILKCKEHLGQIVTTFFYGVDSSDVRKQTGEFGIAFKKTCETKTEDKRRKWSQALKGLVNIAGEHSLNWDKEADMIAKIAKEVSNKLNATISKDFEDMVGIEAHLQNMKYLLRLQKDKPMIVGIFGPAGIGKTTIARALHSRLCSSFQLTCFMENISGSYDSGLDEHGLKLYLQEKLLSMTFDMNGMGIYHLGTMQEILCNKKVLIILDDVDDLKQLEALAGETTWFGPGSRIVVTTKSQELLQQHGIDKIYRVGVPSDEEALKIFCRNAFKQSYPDSGFEKLAKRVTELCSKLPLGLRVVGSSLHGKKEQDWEEATRRLEANHDHREIEKVLRVRYETSKSWRSTGMAFLVVVNLLIEIASAVSEQLSSVHKPYFARVSLVMSVLSVVLSILDLTYKIRAGKARFRWKWMPIPWFYYPARDYNRIFGSSTDTALLFCGVGQLIVSTITCVFIQNGQDGPINVSVWPLLFAIVMVISKFMEKPAISEETLPFSKTQ